MVTRVARNYPKPKLDSQSPKLDFLGAQINGTNWCTLKERALSRTKKMPKMLEILEMPGLVYPQESLKVIFRG